jgi:hypothetical protein
MKRLSASALLIAGLCLAGTAGARDSTVSPLLGSWSVDVSRLPVPSEARPKSVTMTFASAADGEWTTIVDIVASDGSATHGSSSYRLDGTPAPVVGSPEADVSAVALPAPDVLVMVLGHAGQGGSTRVYTALDGGQAMTETATYYRQDGTPFVRTNYFTRAR